ncbi:anthranilate synthase component I [Bordetella pertussis]|nr:anthranilate synthase component I [Bordetella pertussis]
MTELEFKALAAQGYNRIPLVAETYADLDTPLAIYLKLAHSGPQGGRMSCLMESVVGGERFGRYSFIGLPARTVIRASGSTTEVLQDGHVAETHEGDPLAFIESYQARFKVALRPGMPRFCGGLAGYFGYDTVRYIEQRLGPAVKPFPDGMEEGTPDIMLLHVDELVIVDNLAGRTYLMVYADPAQPEAYSHAQQRLLELRARLRRPVEIPYSYASMQTEERRDFQKADYLAAVARAKEYIAAGDVMQVQVGQVIAKPFRDAPLSLYRALRSLNPRPICISGTSAISRWSAPRRKSWCARSRSTTRAKPARRSPSGRWPAPASAAARPKKTWRWPPNCRPTPRSAPNT